MSRKRGRLPMKRNNQKAKPDGSQASPRAAVRELARLYEADETGWLERTADLINKRQYDRLDYKHLAEYLLDMAQRDRREVFHRLITLLVHLLKWERQPGMRSRSWEITIRNQRDDLQDELQSKTLRNHALAVLPKAYARARRQAAGETGLDEGVFPTECPYSLEEILGAN